jgi:hypothetical protein
LFASIFAASSVQNGELLGLSIKGSKRHTDNSLWIFGSVSILPTDPVADAQWVFPGDWAVSIPFRTVSQSIFLIVVNEDGVSVRFGAQIGDPFGITDISLQYSFDLHTLFGTRYASLLLHYPSHVQQLWCITSSYQEANMTSESVRTTQWSLLFVSDNPTWPAFFDPLYDTSRQIVPFKHVAQSITSSLIYFIGTVVNGSSSVVFDTVLYSFSKRNMGQGFQDIMVAFKDYKSASQPATAGFVYSWTGQQPSTCARAEQTISVFQALMDSQQDRLILGIHHTNCTTVDNDLTSGQPNTMIRIPPGGVPNQVLILRMAASWTVGSGVFLWSESIKLSGATLGAPWNRTNATFIEPISMTLVPSNVSTLTWNHVALSFYTYELDDRSNSRKRINGHHALVALSSSYTSLTRLDVMNQSHVVSFDLAGAEEQQAPVQPPPLPPLPPQQLPLPPVEVPAAVSVEPVTYIPVQQPLAPTPPVSRTPTPSAPPIQAPSSLPKSPSTTAPTAKAPVMAPIYAARPVATTATTSPVRPPSRPPPPVAIRQPPNMLPLFIQWPPRGAVAAPFIELVAAPRAPPAEPAPVSAPPVRPARAPIQPPPVLDPKDIPQSMIAPIGASPVQVAAPDWTTGPLFVFLGRGWTLNEVAGVAAGVVGLVLILVVACCCRCYYRDIRRERAHKLATQNDVGMSSDGGISLHADLQPYSPSAATRTVRLVKRLSQAVLQQSKRQKIARSEMSVYFQDAGFAHAQKYPEAAQHAVGLSSASGREMDTVSEAEYKTTYPRRKT